MGMESSLIGGGLSLLGGALGGSSAADAARSSAQSQVEAARIAAEAAKFRPVDIISRFGESKFKRGPEGYITEAGYTASPEVQAYQNLLSKAMGGQLQQAVNAPQQYAPLTGAATGLFNLGQQYLAQSPQEAAQRYMENQQALLAPSRERESALLANQLANTGRTGLSVAQGGGLMAANPEAAALANARAMQDLQLAAQAQQAGQQQTAFGAGLFGTGAGLLGQYQQGQVGALSPFQTTLGVQSGLEQLAQQPLTLGAGLGGQQAAYGANAGRFLYGGGMGAAGTMQEANAYNPLAVGLINAGTNKQLTSGLANWWNNSNLMNNVVPQSTFTGGITPSEFSNYQSMGIF